MRSPRLRHGVVVGVMFAVLVALPACGSGSESGSTTEATPPVTITGGSPVTTTGAPRSAPRWETVRTFSGVGAGATETFSILAEAIQWRVRWRCESGTFVLTTTPPPTVRPGPIAEAPCPDEGQAFAIHTGQIRLGVQAQGAWSAIVDQQIDIPLDEQALPGMTTEAVRARGSFYDVEKRGQGTALLYELGGKLFLRLEDFMVSENVDLFVWATDAARPVNSLQANGAERIVLGNLKSTVGNQNYEIPAGVVPSQVRSIVIWCEPVAIAYAAAALAG